MSEFIFEKYHFNKDTSVASFNYEFDDGRRFEEKISFAKGEVLNEELLDKALFLSFVLTGTSYAKTFPTPRARFSPGLVIDAWQAKFFNMVYQEGMSQYAYENRLTRDDLLHFDATPVAKQDSANYSGDGILALQSGGKDSLLTAALLSKNNQPFMPWHVSSTDHHPAVLDTFAHPLVSAQRFLDRSALVEAATAGARNGHVPITYIVQSWAIIQAVLLGKNKVLVSAAHEGEEPYAWIGDLPINHQWSKTWSAEKAFAEYVHTYISPDIQVGSPLRGLTELRVAELFIQNAWQQYGHSFSSCNVANYKQGADNSTLKWCGNCPKCANTFLLFAPFLPPSELKSLFAGQDLFAKSTLQQTFKGLLGIDGVMKPFECVGEIDELRLAYHMAQAKGGYQPLSFSVPDSQFDYLHEYPSQSWAKELVGI